MVGEIVSVGTEILLGQIVDTNAALVGELFAECGIAHYHRQTVGDNLERLTESLNLALSRSDVVITIGGLGPTEDDLTRDGIAAVLDEPLIHDLESERWIRGIFETRKIAWTESQNRQSMRPACAVPIYNSNGTAPGLICRKHGKTIIALPGPKNEFELMLRGPVRAELTTLTGGSGVIHSQVVKVVGIPEATVEKMLGDLIKSSDPTVAPYAKSLEIHLRVTTRAENQEAALSKIKPVLKEIRAMLGDAVYDVEGRTLEGTVLGWLIDRGETLSVAESCTGGGLGSRLTNVPGASAAFMGGAITYANAQKVRFLGVSEEILSQDGAVSKACAEAMAIGANAKFGTDWGLSITGIAGPDGGTPEKPVGLVFIGIAYADRTEVHQVQLRGTRNDIRARAVQTALIALWKSVQKIREATH